MFTKDFLAAVIDCAGIGLQCWGFWIAGRELKNSRKNFGQLSVFDSKSRREPLTADAAGTLLVGSASDVAKQENALRLSQMQRQIERLNEHAVAGLPSEEKAFWLFFSGTIIQIGPTLLSLFN